MSVLLIYLLFLALLACNAHTVILDKEFKAASSSRKVCFEILLLCYMRVNLLIRLSDLPQDVNEMGASYKCSPPLKEILADKQHLKSKMKVKRRGRKLTNDKATVRGAVHHKRRNRRPEFHLDYAPPRTHPPHHN